MEVEVDFVDGKGKIGRIYGYQNIAAMLDVAWGARLRFRVAGANEDAVED